MNSNDRIEVKTRLIERQMELRVRAQKAVEFNKLMASSPMDLETQIKMADLMETTINALLDVNVNVFESYMKLDDMHQELCDMIASLEKK